MGSYDFLADDEPTGSADVSSRPPWLVLVADDDHDVVAVTRSVLRGCRFEDREIEVLDVGSAAEARQLLERRPDVAVILLDVVMETDDAGLRLVTALRDELHLRALRIILRTGQPGFAPERDVIRRYDINDYRLKTELTAHSLYTSVVAALRGYADIAARIHAEQEARLAARSKSQFIANMSHELRTPLNAIIGFSDLIVHGDVRPDDLSDYVLAIRDNGQQLLEVLNALLDMAAIDAGRYKLREQVIAVEDWLTAALTAASRRAAAAGVNLAVHLSGEVPLLFADCAALAQILDNLLSNAIKFSPAGGTVNVSVAREEDGRPAVTVADQGIGIPDARLRDLFQPFTQVDGGFSRHFEGIGLGLAIVKGLVALHGGTIEVASAEGEGTTMTVRLPAERLIPGSAGVGER
jgi:signal transduction histidine kinase